MELGLHRAAGNVVGLPQSLVRRQPPLEDETRVESRESSCSAVEPSQCALEVRDRLVVQIGPLRLLPGPEQILDRLLRHVAAVVVVGELRRELVEVLPIERLHRLRYLPVKRGAPPAQQVLVHRLLGEHVLEGVLLLRQHSLLVDQLPVF